MIVVRLAVGLLYVFGFFLGVPLLWVGTYYGVAALFGSAWWQQAIAGLIIALLVVLEFYAAMAFVLWDRNPIPRFVLPE